MTILTSSFLLTLTAQLRQGPVPLLKSSSHLQSDPPGLPNPSLQHWTLLLSTSRQDLFRVPGLQWYVLCLMWLMTLLKV